jgi:type-2 restriction enzyme scrFI
MNAKEQIINLFYKNVKGNKPIINNCNQNHDGKKGHWLERQFGISANANNASDLLGYELKNQTTSKTTFGDWSANRYIFTDPSYKTIFNESCKAKNQNIFLKIFGKPNENKGGRYSWSGTPCPKIGTYNTFGQKLIIEPNKDIVAIYSYSEDKRNDKATIIPNELQVDNLELARWFGQNSPSNKKKDKCLKDKLEDKFNDKGWFTCKMNSDGVYYKICFGKPINYNDWIELVKKGIVFFDSGMYEGNDRPYAQWRANNNFWDSLIIEEYK